MTFISKINALCAAVGAEDRALRILINGGSEDLSALTTTAKTTLVAAINELAASGGGGGGAAISDTTTTTTTVWSSSKTNSQIIAAIEALVDAAPTTLDTLAEMAARFASEETADSSAFAAINTALADRVAYTATTTTSEQKAIARTNIGAVAAADIGDTSTFDPVAAFNLALTGGPN